jgi:D-alanyl-D-alanine carboxypeptidase
MCPLGDGPPRQGRAPNQWQKRTKQGSWRPAAALKRAKNGEEFIMLSVPVGASRALRGGCLGLAAVVALLALTNDPADARHRRKRSHAKASISSSYDPPYAAIVVDAKNGSVLHQANPDAPRHPASLTKIMTLYLLFERLEAGKISLDTQMAVSEEASRQAPTKLGLKPGSTLKVDDAIKGLVTKSANDAAVVIAEALANGDGDEFARMMTRKARALGMRNTTYRNPNGLPNDEQVTTARDQALLGIAIQERFPKYYRYFSLPSFVYHGRAMRNHNHLLGEVDGVDGIKTGYTRDSGFNLVTSVRRSARHIVAVVMGGRSASSRDARMRGLIEEHIAQASTKPATVQVAEASRPEAPPAQTRSLLAEHAATIPPRANEATAVVAPGSKAPITPVKVKTVTVKLVPPRNAPAAKPEPKPEPTANVAVAQAATSDEALAETLAAAAPIDPPAPPVAAPAHPGVLGKLPAMISAAKEAAVPSAKADEIPTHHTTRGGWAIQIGAYEDEGEAKQKLNNAKGKVARVLQKAEAYIERTVKGAKTYYRARFAGLDRDQAETACKRLKRQDVACMALKI